MEGGRLTDIFRVELFGVVSHDDQNLGRRAAEASIDGVDGRRRGEKELQRDEPGIVPTELDQ